MPRNKPQCPSTLPSSRHRLAHAPHSASVRVLTTNKLVMTNTDELVHRASAHVLANHDGTRHREDGAEHALAVLVPDLGEVALGIVECAGLEESVSERNGVE